jgi:nitrous oxide reductase
MKLILDSENEWGFFVDFETFDIYKIEDDIPDGSFVMVKEREYIEDIDRTVTQSSYGIVEKNKFITMNKREISKLMSKACSKYILAKDTLPPKVKVEKELQQDKPAQLAFMMTNYDTFHLKITSEMLDGLNPFEKIQEIIGNETEKLTLYDREDKWKIEYAKSSRSTCKSCSMKIEKGTVRLGEPYYFEEHLNYRWNHEKCVFWSRLEKEQLEDLEKLEKEDKKRIEGYF